MRNFLIVIFPSLSSGMNRNIQSQRGREVGNFRDRDRDRERQRAREERHERQNRDRRSPKNHCLSRTGDSPIPLLTSAQNKRRISATSVPSLWPMPLVTSFKIIVIACTKLKYRCGFHISQGACGIHEKILSLKKGVKLL